MGVPIKMVLVCTPQCKDPAHWECPSCKRLIRSLPRDISAVCYCTGRIRISRMGKAAFDRCHWEDLGYSVTAFVRRRLTAFERL
jgi:hypothetical protein